MSMSEEQMAATAAGVPVPRGVDERATEGDAVEGTLSDDARRDGPTADELEEHGAP